MVDLQRSMGCIWNIVRVAAQDGPRNSDTAPPSASLSGEKFSTVDSRENFIRLDLRRIGTGVGVSVHVLLESTLLLESLVEMAHRLVFVLRSYHLSVSLLKYQPHAQKSSL
jgi:hypothetical protein